VASFNIENLFSRPKAFNQDSWDQGAPIIRAYQEVNELFAHAVYSTATKQRMRQLLVQLDIYSVNAHGAIRRKLSQNPRWAWLRKNRGKFDRQPQDQTQDIEIIANGRGDWIGWVALAREPTDEVGTRLTARVITDVNADIIGIVEAEDRPSLVRFNDLFLNDLYPHVMLIDGNDDRGIDVAVMTRQHFEIVSIRSNVDLEDDDGEVFSRDCPQYEIRTPSGVTLHVLVNHFKSQSGGGGSKRLRQATAVCRIVNELIAQGEHVVVLGDLNEGPATLGTHAANLAPLFNDQSPLVDCYSLQAFQVGARPGTFDSCGIRNRLDYILMSQSLATFFAGGGIFRDGLWGSRQTRPTDWVTYPDITSSAHQASDHAAVYIDLNI
jgi:endonuclease/exonuclease/phosphatase family metal-dependent hydrolase